MKTQLQIANDRVEELISAGCSDHPIPPVTNDLGRYWDQPPRSAILIDNEHAIMDQKTFDSLSEYTSTFPTGVYSGKMWKCNKRENGKDLWLLVWYGYCKKPQCPNCEKYCSNNFRKIIVV